MKPDVLADADGIDLTITARFIQEAESVFVQMPSESLRVKHLHGVTLEVKALADAYLAREADDAKPVDREWQSMATAPRDGTEILLVVESRAGIPGKMLVGHYMRGGHCIEDCPPIDRGWYYWTGSMFGVAEKPVAWMPLPDWPTNETTPGGGDAAK